MLAIQLNLEIPWGLILELFVSTMVWGTVIVGLVLIVLDHVEEEGSILQQFPQPLPGPKTEENQRVAPFCGDWPFLSSWQQNSGPERQ
jgi:hypothetical protein